MLLSFSDIIMGPLFAILLLFLAFIIWRKWLPKLLSLPVYLTAFALKMISAVMYGLVYQFYYTNGGDTAGYFAGGKLFYKTLAEKPLHHAIQFLQHSNLDGNFLLKLSHIPNYNFLNVSTTFLMIKITGVVNILTFNSYVSTAMLMSFFSFTGLVALYYQIVQQYKKSNWLLVFAFFFIPSVCFWASGIMKDTITLGCICWLTVALIQTAKFNRFTLFWLLLSFLLIYVIIILKYYIFLSFLPAAFAFLLIKSYKTFPTIPVKLLWTFLLVSGFAVVSYYVYQYRLKWLTEVAINKLVTQAEGFQSWHSYIAEKDGGSGYTLGKVEFTLAGVLKKLPASVNVSLFRPFLWEVSNPLMLMSALESILTLLITLFVFIKVGIYKSIKNIFTDPYIAYFFIYAIVFLFAVGFTSYNFGALVRYKIPGYLFYYIALSLMLINTKVNTKIHDNPLLP